MIALARNWVRKGEKGIGMVPLGKNIETTMSKRKKID